MKAINIIKFFYIIFFIFALMVIDVTTLTFLDIYPAILILFINYIFFYFGYSLKKEKFVNNKFKNANKSYVYLYNLEYKYLFFIGFIAIVFSIIVANYYTGQTPVALYNSLLNGKSVYYEYQEYFKEQNRQILSVDKIIYILMLFFIKFIFFYSYISLFLYKKQINKRDKLFLIIITISFLYIGIARGTNFEFFEFILLCTFVLLKKSVKNEKLLYNIVIIFLLIFIMVLIFYVGISARGVVFSLYISDDVGYEYDSFLATISPMFAYIVILIYGYFGFGFYFISAYISNMWLLNIENFFLGLFPLGFFSETLSIKSEMEKIIDIGVKWQPDTLVIINNIGYLGLLIYIFLLGSISKILEKYEKNEVSNFSQFIIVIMMISLPIGNFIFTSSASILIVGLLILYWSIYFIKFKIKC